LHQDVLGRTNRLLSFIRHGPHWKQRVQQLFYSRVYICYRGNVSTEPLPSNDRGIFIEPSSSLATTEGFLPSCRLRTMGLFLPSRCLATIWAVLSIRAVG
jgi:hypothetical protein